MRIRIKGLGNLRDLGGVIAAGGRRVRRGLFYRSDSLSSLPFESVAYLRDKLGIATVIDLRTPLEMEEKPDVPMEGIERLEIPLFDESVIGITRESGSDYGKFIVHSHDREAIRAIIPDMKRIYCAVMEDPMIVGRIGEVLRTITSNALAGRATLFHCSQGKDRTGAVSSLLLTLLGAEPSTVFKEYRETNRIVWPKALRDTILVALFKLDLKAAGLVWKASIAAPAYMKASFETIGRIYGSPAALFRSTMGITDSRRDALRAAALE